MAKRTIPYEFRPSHRDVSSIAYDMGIPEGQLTDQDIANWVSMLLCEELRAIRHERTLKSPTAVADR
jgi:hypothetical protein